MFENHLFMKNILDNGYLKQQLRTPAVVLCRHKIKKIRSIFGVSKGKVIEHDYQLHVLNSS